ncbi:MAG TPA: ectoine synthase [Polyangiales bacterium]|nr:ectoine synthase [Polyangiales bacterium]
MIIRTLTEIEGTPSHVHAETWHSRRLLLRSDQLGFSLHDTVLYAGSETRMWYRHHVEAVYVIAGDGELVDLDSGIVHPLAPFTLYALDRHDRHIVRARTDIRCVCVFNPPLTGAEVHGPDGAYPPSPVQESK